MSRARHLEATRKAILDAAYELMVENDGTDFPVQAIADRADLTHRSVYRYFPSREDLLVNAAMSRIFPDQAQPGAPLPATLQEWIDNLSRHLESTEENFRLLRQVLGAVLASDIYQQREGQTSARFKVEWDLFRSEFPHLDEETAQEQFAVFRQIGSSMTYISFRTDHGLSPARATHLIQSTLHAMTARLAEHDGENPR